MTWRHLMLAVPNVASVPEYALDRMGRFARALLKYLRGAFREILSVWRYELIEFGGEADHVHLLAAIHPALNLSTLINNLKTASARRARNRFRAHLARFYCKPCFWHRAYYVGSVGEASLETVKAYVETQGTTERHRKTTARPPPGRVA